MPHCEDCLRQSPEAGPCYPHTSWRRRLPGAEATCASADCTHVPKRLSTCPSPTAVADPGAPKAGTLAPKSMLCLRLLKQQELVESTTEHRTNSSEILVSCSGPISQEELSAHPPQLVMGGTAGPEEVHLEMMGVGRWVR